MFQLELGAWFGNSMQMLLALIAGDVLSGVAVAVREKKLDLKKLSNFYLSMIVPYLIGYVALALVVKAWVPEEAFGLPFSDSVLFAAWGIIIVSIGKSVIENLKKLFGKDLFDGDA